jgi:hypothetical protein
MLLRYSFHVPHDHAYPAVQYCTAGWTEISVLFRVWSYIWLYIVIY